jgi:hypothetical protein
MYQPFLTNQTNAEGSARIHNLNMGMYFTAVIQADGKTHNYSRLYQRLHPD